MIYIYHKESIAEFNKGDYLAFSSLMALHKYTDISYSTLKYNFNVTGKNQYIKGDVIITKVEPITSKRS